MVSSAGNLSFPSPYDCISDLGAKRFAFPITSLLLIANHDAMF